MVGSDSSDDNGRVGKKGFLTSDILKGEEDERSKDTEIEEKSSLLKFNALDIFDVLE